MTHRIRLHPRRLIIRAAVFLLIGAAVNLGVAWGLVVAARVPSGGIYEDNAELKSAWLADVPTAYPEHPTSKTRYSGRGWEACVENWLPPEDGSLYFVAVSGRSGFPFQALSGEVGFYRLASGNFVHWDQWGIATGSLAPLPFRPIWPGFAINTLLYAAMAAALWYAPGALRRARRWRGRCLTCGYPRTGLAEDAVCPECGRVAKP